jgi:ribosomal protein S18 acetylase RimI-like enzyme
MFLRPARMKDANAIHALLWAARKDIPLEDNFSDAAHVEWVQARCKQRRGWVVEDGGSVAGAMLLAIGTVSHLVVAQNYRRLGIGSMLIEKAKTHSAGATGDELKAEVNPNNERMIRLLLKEGFTYEPLHAISAKWHAYVWRHQ